MDKPNRIIMELHKADYEQYLDNSSCIPDVRVYVTNTVRGKAHGIEESFNQYITIPAHALNREWGYFVYYVAHELAHINDWNIFKHRNHSKSFFDCFQQLCPIEYQHYELNYKPSFGMRFEHKHEYSIMIMKDGVKTFKCRYCNSHKIVTVYNGTLEYKEMGKC